MWLTAISPLRLAQFLPLVLGLMTTATLPGIASAQSGWTYTYVFSENISEDETLIILDLYLIVPDENGDLYYLQVDLPGGVVTVEPGEFFWYWIDPSLECQGYVMFTDVSSGGKLIVAPGTLVTNQTPNEPLLVPFLVDSQTGKPLVLSIDGQVANVNLQEGKAYSFRKGISPLLPGMFVTTDIDFPAGKAKGPFTGRAKVVWASLQVTAGN